MTIEAGLLIGFISVALALAGFYAGRLANAKNSGQEWGELKTNVKHIKDDVFDIKNSIKESSRDTSEAIEKESAERREDVRRLDKRIDDLTKCLFNNGSDNFEPR